MINTKLDRANLYLKLTEMDVLTKLGPSVQNRKEFNVPWVYTQYMYEARCDAFHRVYHQQLRKIHSFCRSCWKVVVRPRNVVQLFDLYEFQRELGFPCKCGYEARDTVFGLWGGYFYNRSLEEARTRYKQVREWANSVDRKIVVLLKRYCTEFEIGPDSLGPSDKLPEMTDQDIRDEIQFDNFLQDRGPRYDLVQPDYIRAHVMRKWIHWAYSGGDETYLVLTGGNPLFPKYVTYHQEE